MNSSLEVQSTIDSSTDGIFCINFNQDYSSIGIGTRKGYKLFTLNSDDKIEEICNNDKEDTFIVERLFSSSLVAVASLSSPRKLRVCHFKKQSEICQYDYCDTILAVKLNRSRLIVCLEEYINIHDIKDMEKLHVISDTPPNLSGLCALSISGNCYLAYPGSTTVGHVQIFDALNLQSKTMIPAHDSALAALAFNDAGTKIATASEKGTVIRVFNVSDGTRLYELRRGIKRCATIYSLSFSSNSLYLVCSSNTETVHIFKLEELNTVPASSPDDQSGLMGWMTKAIGVSTSYLPTQVSDMLSQGRSFATATLPFQGIKNTAAITTIRKQQRVVVAASDGYLYIYNLNTTESGECTLLKQHRLFGGKTSSVGTESDYESSKEDIKSDVDKEGGSYARVVKGAPGSATQLSEAEKLTEIASACEAPSTDPSLQLKDVTEYPPMW